MNTTPYMFHHRDMQRQQRINNTNLTNLIEQITQLREGLQEILGRGESTKKPIYCKVSARVSAFKNRSEI